MPSDLMQKLCIERIRADSEILDHLLRAEQQGSHPTNYKVWRKQHLLVLFHPFFPTVATYGIVYRTFFLCLWLNPMCQCAIIIPLKDIITFSGLGNRT